MNACTRETVTPDVVVPARVALYRRPDRPRRNGKCTLANFPRKQKIHPSIQFFLFLYVQTVYQAHERGCGGSLLRVLHRQRYQICFPRLTSSDCATRRAALAAHTRTVRTYVSSVRDATRFFLYCHRDRGD